MFFGRRDFFFWRNIFWKKKSKKSTQFREIDFWMIFSKSDFVKKSKFSHNICLNIFLWLGIWRLDCIKVQIRHFGGKFTQIHQLWKAVSPSSDGVCQRSWAFIMPTRSLLLIYQGYERIRKLWRERQGFVYRYLSNHPTFTILS